MLNAGCATAPGSVEAAGIASITSYTGSWQQCAGEHFRSQEIRAPGCANEEKLILRKSHNGSLILYNVAQGEPPHETIAHHPPWCDVPRRHRSCDVCPG